MDTILFDLDGTLLSMNLEAFIEVYFGLLVKRFENTEYDEKLMIKAIYAGTEAMQKNDGKQTNAVVFWQTFEQVSGISALEVESEFTQFYQHDFQQIEQQVQINQSIVEAVAILKEKGYRLICATNPLFPSIASEARLRWSGVDVDAFEHITTFEDFHYCKPNPSYFKELMTLYSIDEQACMMVGNDTLEDGAIQALGVPLYLLEDHLIHRGDEAITVDWMGDSKQFLEVVKGFPNVH